MELNGGRTEESSAKVHVHLEVKQS